METTQVLAIRTYFELNPDKELTPAKLCGRKLCGVFMGSETPRLCRKLCQRGELGRYRDGRFTVFFKINKDEKN